MGREKDPGYLFKKGKIVQKKGEMTNLPLLF